jgi:hypothetical protein
MFGHELRQAREQAVLPLLRHLPRWARVPLGLA